MALRKKIFVFAGVSSLALLILLIVALPFLIDVDRHRPRIAAYIEERTGKPAEIGRLTLTIFPTLSIRVDDFVLGNPDGFPEGDFFRARRIFAELDRGALWDRRVIIRSLEINDPVIALLSNARGKWNFENPAAPSAPSAQTSSTAEPSEPAFTLGLIERVSITGAQITAAKLVSPTRAAPNYFEAANLATELVEVNLNAFATAQSASLSPAPNPAPPTPVIPPAPSDLSRAKSREVEGRSAATRDLHFVIPRSAATRDLHFHSPLPVPRNDTSVSFRLFPTAFAQDTQPQPAASGTLTADSLRFDAFAVSSVTTRVRLFPREVFLDDLNFGLYQGRASGGLSFDFSGANPAYAVAARLTGVDMASLLASFPNAQGKMTGTMDGDIKLNGVVTNSPDPLAGAAGTGQLSIRDGKLPSLNLNQNLMRLARFTQFGSAEGDPSSFSSIAADFNIAKQRITTQQLHAVGNGVEITAAGSLAIAGQGNVSYEGVANVVAGANPVSSLVANLSGATFADGKLSFPFALTGTLEKPTFRLKSAGGANQLRGFQNLLGGSQQPPTEGQPQEGQTQPAGPGGLIRGLTGIFGRKQQPAPQPTEPAP